MDKIGKQQQWGNATNSKAKKWNCPLCNTTRDNLEHLLLDCNTLEKLRNKLMEKVWLALDTAQEPHTHRKVKPRGQFFARPESRRCPDEQLKPYTSSEFQQLPRETKVQILLGKQIGCQTAEGYIDGHVKRFLKKAWKLRSPYVADNNKKYGRYDFCLKGS